MTEKETFKLFRTSTFPNEITQVEGVKETEKSYVIRGGSWDVRERRVLKKSDSEQFFKTWEEAHEHLLNRAKRNAEAAKRNFIRQEKWIAEIYRMKKPEDVE